MSHWGLYAASQDFIPCVENKPEWPAGGDGVFSLFSECIPYEFSCTDGLLYFGHTLEGMNCCRIFYPTEPVSNPKLLP